MSLQEQLNADLKGAIKSREKIAVETIRGLKAMLREREIEKRDDLTEQDRIKVLSTAAKQRREAIESYEQGGRQELADKERAELEIIENYLPKQLSNHEIEVLVDSVIREAGAETMQDMGRVMGAVMPQIQGQADGSKVQEIVRSKLS